MATATKFSKSGKPIDPKTGKPYPEGQYPAGVTDQVVADGKPAKEKKEKVKRVPWGDRDEKGRLKTKIKGKDVPGFDAKIHLPLKRSDFENPADALELKADRMEAAVARLRKQAADERALGNVADRKKAKTLRSLHERLQKMTQELKSTGMSDEEIAKVLAD